MIISKHLYILSLLFYSPALVMDSEYLQTHLGGCLTECLTEVSEKRPLDPIEYMAQWLYKHIQNTQHCAEVTPISKLVTWHLDSGA